MPFVSFEIRLRVRFIGSKHDQVSLYNVVNFCQEASFSLRLIAFFSAQLETKQVFFVLVIVYLLVISPTESCCLLSFLVLVSKCDFHLAFTSKLISDVYTQSTVEKIFVSFKQIALNPFVQNQSSIESLACF